MRLNITMSTVCLIITSLIFFSEVSTEETCTNSIIDLVFVVDGSGSICDPSPRDTTGLKGCSNWNRVANFIAEFIRRLKVSTTGNHASIVSYSSKAETLVYLKNYTDSESLAHWVNTNLVYPDGTTATAAGLLQAMNDVLVEQNGDRNNANNVVVLLTDGIPTVPGPEDNARNQALEAVEELKEKATVFSIGVTDLVDVDFLKDVSTGKEEERSYFRSPTFEDLDKILDQVMLQTCVTPTPKPDCQSSVIDLVFVVDASGSICEPAPINMTGNKGCSNWNLVADFIAEFVKELHVSSKGNHVAIVTYSNEAKTEVYLDQFTDSAALVDWVTTELPYVGGETATSDGLLQAMNDVLGRRGDRAHAQNVVVVITDGIPTVPGPNENARTQALNSAAKLKEVAKIFSVGITNSVDSEFLRDLSSDGKEGQDFFRSASFEALEEIQHRVISQACDIVSSDETENTPQPSCTGTIIDLVFILDGSGSICDPGPRDNSGLGGCTNWDHVSNFVTDFVEQLHISSTGNRVGIVTFSSSADARVYLDQYTDFRTFADWIQTNLKFPDGETATAEGIRKAINAVFTKERGDRSSVQNVAIILTDGIPTIPKPEANARAEALAAAADLREIAKVFSIGVTENVDEAFLKDVSTGRVQGKNYFQSLTFSGLQTILNQVMSLTCVTTTTTPSTTSPEPTTAPPETTTSFYATPGPPTPYFEFVIRLQPKILFVNRGWPRRLMCTLFNTRYLPYNSGVKFRWYDNTGHFIALQSNNFMVDSSYFHIPNGISYWQSSLYVAPFNSAYSGSYTCEVNYGTRYMLISADVYIRGCPCGEFLCLNHKACIPCGRVCNRVNDCGDYSDELGCPLDIHDNENCTMLIAGYKSNCVDC